MKLVSHRDPTDTPILRKERGAFFTSAAITRFIANWALRTPVDRVLEPAAGDAAFLVSAVERLRELAPHRKSLPLVYGVEIHAHSANVARQRVADVGGTADIQLSDFFAVKPNRSFNAVIGNPPFIRYQDFTGEARARAREVAIREGVSLTGLASSWAAFTVHSTSFLQPGGRLGFVLPAELLSVNYAAPVRKFLFSRFRDVQLVLFDEQVFPEAEADVVLLLADGYLEGPTSHATIRQTKNAETLANLGPGQSWTPADPAAKWTSSLIDAAVVHQLRSLTEEGLFLSLETWGDTTLGMVTGNNRYFTLSPERVAELKLGPEELVSVSPPGSSHLRGLSLSNADLEKLGQSGSAIHLFYPSDPPSPAAAAYIADGHRTGVDTAYKCRVRKTWYRVPLIAPADLFLTCMNADTPRITDNAANAHHLNSIHGVYLNERYRHLGKQLLPLASLNSVTLLHAEMVGRAYGGGILKIEPREADMWAMPSPTLVASRAERLREDKRSVAKLLDKGRLLDAVQIVDQVLFADVDITAPQLEAVRNARAELANRRTVRSASGR